MLRHRLISKKRKDLIEAEQKAHEDKKRAAAEEAEKAAAAAKDAKDKKDKLTDEDPGVAEAELKKRNEL